MELGIHSKCFQDDKYLHSCKYGSLLCPARLAQALEKDKKIMNEVVKPEPEEKKGIMLAVESCDMMIFADEWGCLTIQLNVPNAYVKLLSNLRESIDIKGFSKEIDY